MKFFAKILVGFSLSFLIMINLNEAGYASGKTTSVQNLQNELAKIEKQSDFSIFKPQQVPEEWSVVIKPQSKQHTSLLLLTYVNNQLKDDYMMVGIQQRKAGNEERNEKGKNVDINGNKATFQSWSDNKLGGVLSWIQEGTYIEIDSTKLNEKEMIILAKSMEKVNKKST